MSPTSSLKANRATRAMRHSPHSSPMHVTNRPARIPNACSCNNCLNNIEPCKSRCDTSNKTRFGKTQYESLSYELYDARKTDKKEDLYTSGAAAIVKINAEDRSIIAMLPTNSMVQLMQLCVDNGRRFRKLRKALQPEMEEATKDSQLCASKIKDRQSNIKRVEVILKAQGASAGHTLKNARTQ
jgi:hypothetical protein